MALITGQELTIGFRGPALLDQVDFQIELGERIGLLGRNGAGKTTLMRILCGQEQPDSGELQFAPGTRVAFLRQDVPQGWEGLVAEVIADGVGPDDVTEAGDEHEVAWRAKQQVDQLVSRMELDPEARFEVLSSGMKRRVLLARALVSAPDLLLLDEPTNHLDIEAILWLEDFLSRWRGTLMFVTHDRAFLRKLAQRIFEIERGRLFDWSCDYDTFVRRKEAAWEAEQKQNALFDKRLAQEEAWIRQGIKARRTRNEGRVKALKQMRQARSERQERVGEVSFRIEQGQRSGNLIADVEDVSFAYGERQIVKEFSTTIMRGDKVGIIGRNGSGKTTLLRILLGQLPPQAGSVRLGTNLQIAYFDQLRAQLDDERTVLENVGDGGDTIQIGGQSKHLIGYLKEFLFSPERARTPVRFLSGGERNRILLARLFAKPANVIVLDEPTNDLDAETLELLEERLVEFSGTLLLVSHDREFLNHVVTSTIVFEAGGTKEYVGGYDDWLRQRSPPPERVKAKSPPPTKKPAKSPSDDSAKRLSYKEQQELDGLPSVIEGLEADLEALYATMAGPDFYQQAGPQIATAQSQLKELEGKLAAAYARWEALSDRCG